VVTAKAVTLAGRLVVLNPRSATSRPRKTFLPEAINPCFSRWLGCAHGSGQS
jgi:hypothetical protein